MAKCSKCAMFEFCADAPAEGRCEVLITRERARERKKDSCNTCVFFNKDKFTCTLDPEGTIVSIYYLCDKWKGGG